MKLEHLPRVAQLEAERLRLFELRQRVSAGCGGWLRFGNESENDDIALCPRQVQFTLDQLILINRKALNELGVQDVPVWQPAALPPLPNEIDPEEFKT